MVLIGSFYIMTTFLGFGAATIVGPDFIKTHGGTNMSAPLLANALAGSIFFAFISAIAFATILAVVAGLTISATTSFSHDFWTNVIHNGVERKPGEEVMVARISAFGSIPKTRFPFLRNSSAKKPVPDPTSVTIESGVRPHSRWSSGMISAG